MRSLRVLLALTFVLVLAGPAQASSSSHFSGSRQWSFRTADRNDYGCLHIHQLTPKVRVTIHYNLRVAFDDGAMGASGFAHVWLHAPGGVWTATGKAPMESYLAPATWDGSGYVWGYEHLATSEGETVLMQWRLGFDVADDGTISGPYGGSIRCWG
jgi:hypothetical protein